MIIVKKHDVSALIQLVQVKPTPTVKNNIHELIVKGRAVYGAVCSAACLNGLLRNAAVY